MNRQTGCTYWTYSIKEASAGLMIGKNIVRSSSIYLINDDSEKPALIVAGDSLGIVYVVNAETGEEIWQSFLGTNSKYHWITGGFQYHDGKLFVPFSSKEVITTAISLEKCCDTHGLLQAVDPYNGKILWTYHTTNKARFRFNTRLRGPNGVGLWGVPAIDAERNTLYIGTGQNYTPPLTKTSDAIIALNMDDGSVRWIYQATDDDAWNASCELPAPLNRSCAEPKGHDFDFGAPPVLVQQADGIDVVLAADKGGVVYSINADNGKLNWSRKVGKGSALGGVHWGMAVDNSNLYVAVADTFADKTSALNIDLAEILAGGISPPISPVEGGTPGIYALDIQTGQQIWYITPEHIHEGESYISVFSAALSVTNDVLFAGALDGEMKAFNTVDGSELWHYDSNIEFVDVAGNAGKGGTIDSVGAIPVDDMLLLNSGYDNFGGIDAYQAGPGNGLFIFRLPQ